MSQKLVSHIISTLVCLMIATSLTVLPPLGLDSVGSVFVVFWLGFALLVLTAHLRVVSLASKDRQRKLYSRVSKKGVKQGNVEGKRRLF